MENLERGGWGTVSSHQKGHPPVVTCSLPTGTAWTFYATLFFHRPQGGLRAPGHLHVASAALSVMASVLPSLPTQCLCVYLFLWGFQKREGLLHSSHVTEELTTSTE